MAIKDSTDKVKNLAVGDGTPSDVDYCLRRQKHTVYFNVAAAAVTATSLVYHATKACVLKGFRLVPSSATVGPAADYIQVSLKSGDAAGGALGTAYTTSYSTRNAPDAGFTITTFTQGEVSEFGGVADTDSIAAGQYVFLEVVGVGAGKALAGVAEIEVELT